MSDRNVRRPNIQYPTKDLHSLQRSVVQLKELVESDEFLGVLERDSRSLAGAAAATVGDAFPPTPSRGALHYKTTAPIGLHVWDGSQWVQT